MKTPADLVHRLYATLAKSTLSFAWEKTEVYELEKKSLVGLISKVLACLGWLGLQIAVSP